MGYINADKGGRIIEIYREPFSGLIGVDWWPDDSLMDKHGRYLYMTALHGNHPDRKALCTYVYNGEQRAVYERTQGEMDADYTPPVAAPDGSMESLAAEVAALKESNAQLQEALDLLLSGEVE